MNEALRHPRLHDTWAVALPDLDRRVEHNVELANIPDRKNC